MIRYSLSLSVRHSSSLASFKSKLETYLFLHTDLSFSSHCTNPSPVMHVFGEYVCVCVCVCVCVRVCVHACMFVWCVSVCKREREIK